jgi:transposase
MEAKKKSITATGKYPAEIRTQAIEMFQESRTDYGTRAECARHVAGLLGIGSSETVLSWVRQAEVDNGERGGISISLSGYYGFKTRFMYA